MTTRNFHLGDVLSVTDGHLVSPSGIGGVYEILNFMTGDKLFTHQLPRAAKECRPWLLRQHPQLADAHFPEDASGREAAMAWLDEMVAKYGENLDVQSIPREDHARRDPIAELEDMIGSDRVIIVQTEDPS